MYSFPHNPPTPATSTTYSNSHTGETAQRDRGARVHPTCWLHRRSSQGVYAKRSPKRLALISFFLFLCSVRSSSKFLIWPRRRTPTTTSSSYATRCARRHSSLSFHIQKTEGRSRSHALGQVLPSSLSPWHPEDSCVGVDWRTQEEILNVEFSKLQNLATVMSAADETPLELSILSTKVGSVRDRLLHANQLPGL